MKKLFLLLTLVGLGLCTVPLSHTYATPPTNLGCVNYSGANYLGSVVLANDGTPIGCNQPSSGDSDLIPLGSWNAWTGYFANTYPSFLPRLGFQCDDCWMGADGMNGQVGIPLGFTINYYGSTYTGVFVNSNGSISFGQGAGAYNQPLNQILGSNPGVCAYCLDLENSRQIGQLISIGSGWTTGTSFRHSDFVYRGRTTFSGRQAFVATWMNMSIYGHNENENLRNTFQIMLVDTSDSNDDVNIIVNYGSIRNSNQSGYCSPDGSGNTICGRVAIGLGNASGGVTIYNSIVDDSGNVLDGKLVGDLRDAGDFALNTLHLNSSIAGRFIFQMEGGTLPGAIIDIGPGCTDPSATNYLSGASSDNGNCSYILANLQATGDDKQIFIGWHPFSGHTLLSYTLTYSGADNTTGEITQIPNDTTGYTLTGLNEGVNYNIQLCALYAHDEQLLTTCSSTSATTLTPVVAPTAPTPPRAFGGGGGGGGGYSPAPTYLPPLNTTPTPTTPIIIPTVTNPTAPSNYPTSYQPIYDWAYQNHLTTMPMAEARLNDTIQRYEAAKIIVNYVENVLHKTIASNPECIITSYGDYGTFDTETKGYIQKICNLQLMGWNTPRSSGIITKFRPFDYLSVNEFNIIISRYLDNSSTTASSNKRIDIMKFLKDSSGN